VKAPNFSSAFTFIFSKDLYLDKINGCFDYLNLFDYSNELYVLVNSNSSVYQNIQFTLTISRRQSHYYCSALTLLRACSSETTRLLSGKRRRAER